MSSWRIPPAHKAKASQLRCINAVRDALQAVSPLPEDDPRVVEATKVSTYKYTPGEHLQVPEPQMGEIYAQDAGNV
jgi:hypothetical protein